MLLLEVRELRGAGGGRVRGRWVGGGGGAGCNRLVTSIGELTLGPFPCQLRPGGGDVLVRRIFDGSGHGNSGQGSKPAGLIN